VENLLLRGQRPLVSAIYQNQPLSHYLPPNMQLLQGQNGQVKLRVSFVKQPKGKQRGLLNNQRALLERQRGIATDTYDFKDDLVKKCDYRGKISVMKLKKLAEDSFKREAGGFAKK
jgi:hypothetical protein